MERDIQSSVLKYLNSLPGCMAENVRGNASQSGRADINACYKGNCLKIELKDPNDKSYGITAQQKLYLEKWKRAGAIVKVCYSLDDVKMLINKLELEQINNEISRKLERRRQAEQDSANGSAT